MYYESKNDKLKEQIMMFIFFVSVISLLIILILKLDGNNINQTELNNYETSKLSTENEQNVENNIQKHINEVVKTVVGISKLKQNGTSIFLDNSEQKLGLGSGIILSDNGYILTNQHVAGNKYSNCYVTLENGQIYDGTVADGCYYNGNTLSGVNVRYATDKNWANAVYSWMKYLYNRL